MPNPIKITSISILQNGTAIQFYALTENGKLYFASAQTFYGSTMPPDLDWHEMSAPIQVKSKNKVR